MHEEESKERSTILIRTDGQDQKRSPSLEAEDVLIADNSQRDIQPGDTDEPIERHALPWLKDPNSRPSLWTIIKDTMGKDFSKMSVPVYFNDPTSLL